jgi:hypothetical protein
MISRIVVATGMLAIVATGVLGERVLERGTWMAGYTLGPGQSPIRSMLITVPQEKRPWFFERMQAFAKFHRFKIYIEPMEPDGGHIAIALYRDDVELHSDSISKPEEFDTSFYQSGDEPISSKDADDLVGYLKGFLSEIPGVTVAMTCNGEDGKDSSSGDGGDGGDGGNCGSQDK